MKCLFYTWYNTQLRLQKKQNTNELTSLKWCFLINQQEQLETFQVTLISVLECTPFIFLHQQA